MLAETQVTTRCNVCKFKAWVTVRKQQKGRVNKWAAGVFVYSDVAPWLCFQLLFCLHLPDFNSCGLKLYILGTEVDRKAFSGILSSITVLSALSLNERFWFWSVKSGGFQSRGWTARPTDSATDYSNKERNHQETHTIIRTTGYRDNCSQPAMFSSSVHPTAHDRAKHTWGTLTSPSQTHTHTYIFSLR